MDATPLETRAEHGDIEPDEDGTHTTAAELPSSTPAPNSAPQSSLSQSNRVAQAWQRAVNDTAFVSLAHAEVHEALVALAERLLDIVTVDADVRPRARGIGADFAQLGFTTPLALERSLEVLLAALTSNRAPSPRLSAALHAFAAGFTQRAQDHIFEQQEAILGAVMLQRQRAEAALTEQFIQVDQARARLQAVLDAAGDGMLFVTEDRRVLLTNRRFSDFTTIARERLIGATMSSFSSLIDKLYAAPDSLYDFMSHAAHSADVMTQDFEQVWPQQRTLQVVSTPVFAADGAYLGRLHVFRDVTGERAVDRMKTELVSLVSHELRTPLTAIKGYLDLVLAEETGSLLPEQRDFLSIVQSNTNRLVTLVSDLLDLSRIESGAVELEREPLNLKLIIDEVATTFRPQIEQKAQQLIIEVPPDLPWVLGDSRRIFQILTNLLSNAHKYTLAGGMLRLSASAETTTVRTSITDTGVGLAPEDQARLFTRFFRAKNRATEGSGGTGLGLAITQALVKLHGGDVGLVSRLGVGSTFWFTLPTEGL